jgi:hypothetical protein
MAEAQLKSKFENVSKGVAGAVVIGLDGKPQGVPVPFKGVIWLSEEEEILTANAPRNEADNPFTNGTFKLLTRGTEIAHARPIGSLTQSEPGEPADAEPAAEPPPEPPAPPAPDDRPPSDDAAGAIRQEQPPTPPPPPPPSAGSPSAGAQVVNPDRPVMRQSSSPAAAGNPPGGTPAPVPPPAPAPKPKAP